jgi:hypothetical protein
LAFPAPATKALSILARVVKATTKDRIGDLIVIFKIIYKGYVRMKA